MSNTNDTNCFNCRFFRICIVRVTVWDTIATSGFMKTESPETGKHLNTIFQGIGDFCAQFESNPKEE